MSVRKVQRPLVGLAFAGLVVGASLGCQQQNPASGDGAQMSSQRLEALIAADKVISDGERMHEQAVQSNDAQLMEAAETRVAEGKQMKARAAAMK